MGRCLVDGVRVLKINSGPVLGPFGCTPIKIIHV